MGVLLGRAPLMLHQKPLGNTVINGGPLSPVVALYLAILPLRIPIPHRKKVMAPPVIMRILEKSTQRHTRPRVLAARHRFENARSIRYTKSSVSMLADWALVKLLEAPGKNPPPPIPLEVSLAAYVPHLLVSVF